MRVLLVRLDGIGDALVCTPLILALRDAGHEVNLALSDRNAAVFAPGTNMAYPGINNDQTRADVIAYLNKNSDNPTQLPGAK